MAREKYSDIDMNFRKNPFNGDLLRLNTEDSIAQSVKNLVLIRFYEKHFKPTIGNFAAGALFEGIEDTTILLTTRRSIARIIREYEPRVRLNDVRISDADAVDANSIKVHIDYTIIGRVGESSVEFILRRVR